MFMRQAPLIAVCNLQIAQKSSTALFLIKLLTDLSLLLCCDEKCAASFAVVTAAIGHLIFAYVLSE